MNVARKSPRIRRAYANGSTEPRENGYVYGDPYMELAYAIVMQAINDYRLSGDRTKVPDKYGMNDVENFLLSDWCTFLLIDIGLSGERILHALKGES